MWEDGLTVVGFEWEFAVADNFLGHDAGNVCSRDIGGFSSMFVKKDENRI